MKGLLIFNSAVERGGFDRVILAVHWRPPNPPSPKLVDPVTGCRCVSCGSLFSSNRWPYIAGMVSRSSRGRPGNAPAAFIHPCRPVVAKHPPIGPGCAHELKHDGYRLQIHVRDGRVRLYTMNGNDWTARYPRIVEQAARIKGSAIIDAEVVCLDADGVAQFEDLHSRTSDRRAIACAFDLLMLDGDDLRGKPLAERKAALRKILRRTKGGIQFVKHVEGHGAEMFEAVCELGLEGIVSKRLNAPYRSGPSRNWIKVKNPKAAAVTRVL
jgi:bifunctional non-homologous end joining protein LigD